MANMTPQARQALLAQFLEGGAAERLTLVQSMCQPTFLMVEDFSLGLMLSRQVGQDTVEGEVFRGTFDYPLPRVPASYVADLTLSQTLLARRIASQFNLWCGGVLGLTTPVPGPLPVLEGGRVYVNRHDFAKMVEFDAMQWGAPNELVPLGVWREMDLFVGDMVPAGCVCVVGPGPLGHLTTKWSNIHLADEWTGRFTLEIRLARTDESRYCVQFDPDLFRSKGDGLDLPMSPM